MLCVINARQNHKTQSQTDRQVIDAHFFAAQLLCILLNGFKSYFFKVQNRPTKVTGIVIKPKNA